MKAGELCNRQVVIASPELSVVDAARRMREHHVGDLIIVEPANGGNEPVGIVTDRDLVLEVLADNAAQATSMRVAAVMTCELVTAREEDDVADILRTMRRSGVRRMPVVNTEGSLEGILTYDDLLEWFVEELEGLVAVVEGERRVEEKRAALLVEEEEPRPH
jgi:CBS domain-containing protein